MIQFCEKALDRWMDKMTYVIRPFQILPGVLQLQMQWNSI